MKKIFLSLSILLAAAFTTGVNAQMSVGTSAAPNANAVLDLVSGGNKGLLLPRVALTSTTSAAPLSAHVAGMHVYNTATAGTYPNNVTPGEYYNDGSKWIQVSNASDMAVIPSTVVVGNNIPSTGGWTYTGNSVTLPPGKWQVNVTMLLSTTTDGTSSRFTGSDEYWWLLTSFADTSTGTLLPTSSRIGATYISANMPSNAIYNQLSGSLILNNTTTSNKTFYYIAKVNNTRNAPAGASIFKMGNGDESSISYQRVY